MTKMIKTLIMKRLMTRIMISVILTKSLTRTTILMISTLSSLRPRKNKFERWASLIQI